MVLDCMICMEMCGSGLPIGMDVRIRMVVRGVEQWVRNVLHGVVDGTTPQPNSSHHSAPVATRRFALMVPVFDFARSFNPRLFFAEVPQMNLKSKMAADDESRTPNLVLSTFIDIRILPQLLARVGG